MLYRAGLIALLCGVMDSPNGKTVNNGDNRTLLSKYFTERLAQLGLSRREFVRRSGISRQTLHHIEHEGRTALAPSTYAKLDEHLHWSAGTAYALANGDDEPLRNRPIVSGDERESALRWKVVRRIQTLTIEELEALLYAWEEAGEDDET